MTRVKTCYDVVDRLVDLELFTAENVDESMPTVWKSMNADVALGDDYETADSPFCGI